MNTRTIENIPIAQVKAEGGPAGAQKAFAQLESRMQTLKGRKMYGLFYQKTGEYYASVRLDEQQQDNMGFDTSIIPGGEYATTKINNWSERVNEIGSLFDTLESECARSGFRIDGDRPHIEFYRSQRELIIMIPVNHSSET